MGHKSYVEGEVVVLTTDSNTYIIKFSPAVTFAHAGELVRTVQSVRTVQLYCWIRAEVRLSFQSLDQKSMRFSTYYVRTYSTIQTIVRLIARLILFCSVAFHDNRQSSKRNVSKSMTSLFTSKSSTKVWCTICITIQRQCHSVTTK